MGGIGTPLVSLPLFRQADTIDVWFAGRADFGAEQERTRDTHFRTARWDTVKPGDDCSIKESQITIRRDGGVNFAARVKSKDDGDRYCVILNLVNHSRVNVWRSSKICTPFELATAFPVGWIPASLFPRLSTVLLRSQRGKTTAEAAFRSSLFEARANRTHEGGNAFGDLPATNLNAG
jgi:hypothetical protein